MEKKITITFSWWNETHDAGVIHERHLEALEESAIERIQKMWNEGYTSGDLHDNVRMTDDDGEDGIEYSGWWDLTTENIKPKKSKRNKKLTNAKNI